MDVEQAELLQTSPLIQRLDLRRTQAGVINLSRYSTESTGLPNSIVQRSALVEQLQTRYSSRDPDLAGGTELALATVSPPTDRVSRSPQVTPVGAIAPSTPLVEKEPLTSEPLPLSSIASVIAPSPVAEPDSATFVTAPETITPFNESVGESEIASTQSLQQYRIRRVSANPTTPSATIQRKPASDVSAATVSVSPVQSFHEAVSIAPESPSAKVDDPTSAAIPALGLVTPITSIAPISTFESGEPTTETPFVLRHVSDTPPAEAIVSPEIAQDSIAHPLVQPASLPAIVQRSPDSQSRVTRFSTPEIAQDSIARPLVQPASLPAIVQRSSDSQSKVTGLSTQQPTAIASALPISEFPLQPSPIWRSSSDAVKNGILQRRIQPELPLAISAGQVVQPAIARHTETNGSSTIALARSGSESPPPIPTPTSTNHISVGQIAEQVSRILFRQLTVERERRGMGKWS